MTLGIESELVEVELRGGLGLGDEVKVGISGELKVEVGLGDDVEFGMGGKVTMFGRSIELGGI